MKTLEFDTGSLPPADRFAMFRAGTVDFRVDALADPLDFVSKWRLLRLGDLNAIHSRTSPIHYRRDQAMIEEDGEDRIAIHYYVNGGPFGTLDGRPAAVAAGGAMVWDLTRPVDIRSPGLVEVLIVTLPRFMLDEVMSASSYSCVLPPTVELRLAADQLRHMLDRAEELPDEGAAYFGRALRDLFAVALLPTIQPLQNAVDPTEGPLFHRICHLIDVNPEREFDESWLAATLQVSTAAVRAVAHRFGGLDWLIERRRLLAAYRLLCDPAEAASVSAIAWRCGFSDTSRFNRRFREIFQAAPSDLRRFKRANLPEWAGAYHVEKNYEALIAR